MTSPASTEHRVGEQRHRHGHGDRQCHRRQPTGTVSFTACGPTAAPVSSSPCTATDYPVGTAVGVSAGANDTSTATSAAFTPTSTGYWCFDDSYSGDSTYNSSSDDSTDECVDVTSAPTTTGTAPASSASSWVRATATRPR